MHLVMTRLNEKLKPAKKAWKSFSNTLKSKFHKLNIPKAIKTTPQRLISTLNALIHLIPSAYRRNRSLTSSTRPYYSTTSHYYHIQRKKNNNLFAEPDYVSKPAINKSSFTNTTHQSQGETTSRRSNNNKRVVVHENMDNNLHGGKSTTTTTIEYGSGLDTIEDAWKAVVDKSPHLYDVDEKAEEFIYKFREDMRLQKERSLLEFQEMLARGT